MGRRGGQDGFIFSEQADCDDILDDAGMDNPMGEAKEWMYLANGAVNGTADDNGAPPQKTFEIVHVQFKVFTTKKLAEIMDTLKLSARGTKRVLFDQIWDSSKEEVEKLGNNNFNYPLKVIAGEKKPTWLLLPPEAVPPVQGVDMALGAQVGYFGQTNKENAVRGIRSNFLLTKKIVRPAFKPKKKPKKK
jgi:hypothetical protein